MIVVPAFAHRDEGAEADVVALDAGAFNQMGHWPVTVGEVPDQPVAAHAGGDSGANAPEYESPAAPSKKQ